MKRTERRLLRLADELERLRHAAELAEGELWMHRHLDDDAVRDAVVSDEPADRADARQTAKDVARLESALADLKSRIERVEEKRRELLGRLE